MWPRRQLPVHSPLSLAALAAGVRATLGGGAATRDRLEDHLKRRYRASAVLLTDSGTSALRLALSAAETPRVPVALPGYSCYNVATAAIGAGSRVLLYDVDPRTLGPDPASLSRALTSGARVVLVAHLYGIPVGLEDVRRACDTHGAMLIEDAAQGGGGSWAGQPLGSFGSLSILSFGRGKGTTGGGGGALLAHDPEWASLVDQAKQQVARGHARGGMLGLTAQWILARPSWYGVPASLPFLKLGETIYQAPWPAAPMSDASAGVVTETMALADRELPVRRRHAARLSGAIRAAASLTLVESSPPGEPGHLRLPALGGEALRGSALFAAGRALGVMPGYPLALSELPEFRPCWVNAAAELSGASRLARRLFTLPTHSLLTDHDIEQLETWVRQSAPTRD